MIIQKIFGNTKVMQVDEALVERVFLEWFELEKRLLRKTTDKGLSIGIALEGTKPLQQGDVLYIDDTRVIVVELLETEVIVLKPTNMGEMAKVCYELGNRHAPVFFVEDEVLVPLDQTLCTMFDKLGVAYNLEKRRLENALQQSSHHHH